MFIDIALRSIYEKKHAKKIMDAIISRTGILAGKLIGMLKGLVRIENNCKSFYILAIIVAISSTIHFATTSTTEL